MAGFLSIEGQRILGQNPKKHSSIEMQKNGYLQGVSIEL
jgi:hypothetical protein